MLLFVTLPGCPQGVLVCCMYVYVYVYVYEVELAVNSG